VRIDRLPGDTGGSGDVRDCGMRVAKDIVSCVKDRFNVPGRVRTLRCTAAHEASPAERELKFDTMSIFSSILDTMSNLTWIR
jgi:hypothetical protein